MSGSRTDIKGGYIVRGELIEKAVNEYHMNVKLFGPGANMPNIFWYKLNQDEQKEVVERIRTETRTKGSGSNA